MCFGSVLRRVMFAGAFCSFRGRLAEVGRLQQRACR